MPKMDILTTRHYRILLISDSVDEVKDVTYILHKEFTKFITHCFEGDALEKVRTLKPDLLIIAEKHLEDSEEVVSLIARNVDSEKMPLTLILCRQNESKQAYEIFRMGVIDYFVADRPLVDPFTLITAVTHLLHRRDEREQLRKELGTLHSFIEEMFSAGENKLGDSSRAIEKLASEFDEGLASIKRSLISSGEKAGAFDPQAVTAQINRLHESEKAARNQAISQIVTEQKAWLNELETGYTEHLDALGIQPLSENQVSVLIVDDDDFYRESLSMMFEDYELEIVEANGYESALKYLADNKPTAILLDYEMPGHSGKELLEAIKRMPDHSRIPIIMLTGHHTRDVVLDCIQLGASDFIVKPGDPHNIIKKIEQLSGVQINSAQV